MENSYWQIGISVFILNTLRYFLTAGIAFLIFYILFKSKWNYKKIQQKFPLRRDYFREIVYSFFTILIFVGVAIIIFTEPIRSHTFIYDKVSDYGWGYWFFSLLLMIVVHDTYFYWTHRAMHHPSLFKWFHLVHHKSTNPSPWAAYAFHPLEGIVEAGIVVVFAFTFPFHTSALLVFLLFMIIYNVYGHLGWELYPRGFNKSLIGKWINTSINHNMHHKYFKGNYGLYFLYWDRWMGTLHPDYDKVFDEVGSR